jgi:hypothetical protein
MFLFLFSLQLLSETFFIVRRIKRDIVINVKTSSRKVPVILVRVQWKLNFLDRFSKKKKKLKYQILWKSIDWELSYFTRTDGRTDTTKLTLAFRNFANAPKNREFYTLCLLLATSSRSFLPGTDLIYIIHINFIFQMAAITLYDISSFYTLYVAHIFPSI